MFLLWYDSDRKKHSSAKIEEAMERFIEKYGHQPTVVLVNPGEPIEAAPLPVVARPTVARHSFWVGDEEIAPLPVAAG